MAYSFQAPSSYDLSGEQHAGLSAFLRQTYMWMAVALTVTAAVAQVTLWSPALLVSMARGGGLLVFAGAMGVSFYFARNASRISPFAAANLLLIESALMGLMMAPMFAIYTEASVNRAFYSAAATFSVAALYGLKTKRDLTQLASFYTIGVMGALAAIVINIFMGSELIDFMISMVLVVACTAGVAWESQALRTIFLRSQGAGNAAIIGALHLYCDFINIFISLLRLTGERRD